MAKKSTHKRTRHLEGEVKRLEAQIKRLKKSKDLDKDELVYEELEPSEMIIECVHCKTGFMQEVMIVGRLFFKCLECGKTKKA